MQASDRKCLHPYSDTSRLAPEVTLMTKTPAIVLYAVGSPLVVEVEETCSRLGITIAAAVKNVAGAHYLREASALREPADLDAAIFRIPCLVPLFTPHNRDTATREAMATAALISIPR
jgi:hypothetical protein